MHGVFADSLAASQPDCEIVVGRGGSMLPLYPDGTVLLLRRLPVSDLQEGMIVVFIGDRGRPVAHTLVEKTFRGWTAKGLNNAEPDHTLVRTRNYLGTVVRAFTPVVGLAPAGESATGSQ
jgi:signal peptidase I